jgi:hypothetical protein
MVVCSLSSILHPLQAQASEGRLSLKISGGLDYIGGGDVNDFFLSMNKLYLSSDQGDENLKNLHLGYEGQAEVIYRLSSKWRIGICSGIVQAKRAPNKLIRYYATGDMSVTYHTRISMIPVEARLYFTAISSPKNSLYLHAGIGYNFSHWKNSRDYQYSQSSPSYEYKSAWEEKAEANGFNFRFGIGNELKLLSRLSVVVEGYGRFARLEGFKGEKVVFYPNPTSMTGIRSTLYYFEWNYREDLWTSDLEIIGRPVGSGARNVREACVDFSGIGLMIGLLIHL